MDQAFSTSGDRVLVVTSCAHPKLYDRDGFEMIEFPKGDQYIRDMKNTKYASIIIVPFIYVLEDILLLLQRVNGIQPIEKYT